MKKIIATFIVVALLAFARTSVNAASTCTFTDTGDAWNLESDCTTDETILIPDGYTLNGFKHIITAVDPDGGHFVGAVVANAGAEAYVTHLNVTASELTNTCDAGADRLRGIMFEGASGSITHSSVYGINQGPSGCQEGNAIEIRNEPFDGSHPGTVSVEVAHNTVVDYQKTGIVANGDVEVNIHHNDIGASATQANLAANSVQLGYGAFGTVLHNSIEGNQWLGASDYAATAILIYSADFLEISHNNIRGNSEIGIYNYGNNNIIDNNKIFDIGADEATHGYDIGIGNWGSDNTVTNNKVKGFDDPYDGVTGGKNKAVPGPQPNNVWF